MRAHHLGTPAILLVALVPTLAGCSTDSSPTAPDGNPSGPNLPAADASRTVLNALEAETSQEPDVVLLAARAHLPSLVEAQPCHTDTSGLKVGVVVAAFLFVFFRWKGGSGLDVGSGRFFFRPDWIRVG